ncbi:MAG: hypothetical protein SF162_14545 [bacterium]|nr:hypothetical protein [bacterium]
MLHTLENAYWQTGILPQTGASIAYGRVRAGDAWHDVMRPTAESDYNNSSKCASFIMMPWCNRIRDGLLVFGDERHTLRTEPDDNTARHGDVRKRPWQVIDSSTTHVRMVFDSAAFPDINYPFHFSAQAVYTLVERDFIWRLSLTNAADRPIPAGFGHHPYFVREPHAALRALEIPCDARFHLVNTLAVAPPLPVTETDDFRAARPLDDVQHDDLYTQRRGGAPARLIYDAFEVHMHADPLFLHLLLYAPTGAPFYALEPMTNANDGFNLLANGIDGSGVFVLAPGETVSADVTLRVI